MGIPGFNTWFQQKNRSAYVPLNTIQVDHVYVDLNSILHNALRTGKTWEKFHKRLHAKLNGLLDTMQPRKTVMLAVDGPAPLAKLLTQRSRRKKSGGKSVKGSKDLSGNAITPGTRFMADVTLSLAAWISMKLESRKWQHLQFELSDGTVMGEGEVKILGRLARHWHRNSPDDTHMIVGDDADLVLMACVSWREHLYVANSAMTDEKNLHRDMKVFSVDALHRLWLSKLHPSHSLLPMGDDLKLLSMKMDLALMAILCSGNDYLPGLRGINLEGMWQEYLRQRKHESGVGLVVCSVDSPGSSPYIHLENLVTVLKAAGVHVPRTAGSAAAAAAAAMPGAAVVPDTVMGGGTSDEEEEEGGVAATTYSQAADPDAYLHGLAWVMHMYLRGHCPDYRFTYDRAAPHASSFAAWLLFKSATKPTVSHEDWGPVPPVAQTPLLPVGCAVAMLPGSSADLLPDALQPLMNPSSGSPLAELYEVCDECEDLKVAGSIAMTQRASAQQQVERVSEALRAALDQGGEEALGVAELRVQLADAQADFDAKRQAHLRAIRASEAHKAAAHPYKPFPIDRVAAAMSEVNAQGIPAAEQPLLSFGTPVVLGLPQGALLAGTRMPYPPIPFANNRFGLVKRVASMAVVESLDPDSARLGPDRTWAPMLADHYISQPAGLNLAPAQRAQKPAPYGQQQQQPQQPAYISKQPRGRAYGAAAGYAAGQQYGQQQQQGGHRPRGAVPPEWASARPEPLIPHAPQQPQPAAVFTAATTAARIATNDLEVDVVASSSSRVRTVTGREGGQQLTWQQQQAMVSVQSQQQHGQQQQQGGGRGGGRRGGRSSREPQQQRRQQGPTWMEEDVPAALGVGGVAAGGSGYGVLTWQQQEQQQQPQRGGNWQEDTHFGTAGGRGAGLTWQQQEQMGVGRGRRGRGRSARGGQGRGGQAAADRYEQPMMERLLHADAAMEYAAGTDNEYVDGAPTHMDVEVVGAGDGSGPGDVGSGARQRGAHGNTKRSAPGPPSQGRSAGSAGASRRGRGRGSAAAAGSGGDQPMAPPPVVSNTMISAAATGRGQAAAAGGRAPAGGFTWQQQQQLARPALLPGVMSPQAGAAPIRRQHIRWP